ASGFAPNAKVSLAGGPFGATTQTSDASGAITFREPVVTSTAATYSLTLTDTRNGGHVSIPLYISGISFIYNPATNMTDDFLSASGFKPGETLTVSVAPAGPIAPFAMTADSNGNVSSRSFHIAGAPAGVYTLTATGQTSGFAASGQLTIGGA